MLKEMVDMVASGSKFTKTTSTRTTKIISYKPFGRCACAYQRGSFHEVGSLELRASTLTALGFRPSARPRADIQSYDVGTHEQRH